MEQSFEGLKPGGVVMLVVIQNRENIEGVVMKVSDDSKDKHFHHATTPFKFAGTIKQMTQK